MTSKDARIHTMLHQAGTLTGYTLHALDGEIGKVKDFYFDDQSWSVRYLVAATGKWLLGRQVLISPLSLTGVDVERQQISAKLTRTQIERSPSLDTDQPVSRQFEQEYFGFYGLPMYWGFEPDKPASRASAQTEDRHGDPDLRSTHDVAGHHVQALDGEIGHVKDFMIDVEAWAIRYLIVDTRDWLPGKKVLIAPQWIQKVRWDRREVAIDLSREAIEQAPEYTEALNRDQEIALHRHYNRKGYWSGDSDSVDDFELSRRYPGRFSA
jgi:uncharacterized protein YrrD